MMDTRLQGWASDWHGMSQVRGAVFADSTEVCVVHGGTPIFGFPSSPAYPPSPRAMDRIPRLLCLTAGFTSRGTRWLATSCRCLRTDSSQLGAGQHQRSKQSANVACCCCHCCMSGMPPWGLNRHELRASMFNALLLACCNALIGAVRPPLISAVCATKPLSTRKK